MGGYKDLEGTEKGIPRDISTGKKTQLFIFKLKFASRGTIKGTS